MLCTREAHRFFARLPVIVAEVEGPGRRPSSPPASRQLEIIRSSLASSATQEPHELARWVTRIALIALVAPPEGDRQGSLDTVLLPMLAPTKDVGRRP